MAAPKHRWGGSPAPSPTQPGPPFPVDSVKVLDPKTDTRRNMETNDSGFYTFTNFPVSSYRLKIPHSGFSRMVILDAPWRHTDEGHKRAVPILGAVRLCMVDDPNTPVPARRCASRMMKTIKRSRKAGNYAEESLKKPCRWLSGRGRYPIAEASEESHVNHPSHDRSIALDRRFGAGSD